MLRDKFRGCLVGALLGDCLGAPFEGDSLGPISRHRIENVIGLTSKKLAKAKAESFYYTDDSAMTRCICSSLLTKKCFDATDMVQTFAHEYRQNGNRGYGGGMLYLFDQWNHNGVTCDPFSAAKEQFSGSGSYGNGAAMRVAPVALFTRKEEDLVELARSTALLTHSHKHGYNGAILQALAVHRVLAANGDIDRLDFVKGLRDAFIKLESVQDKSLDVKDEDAKQSDANLHFSIRSDFTFVSQLEKLVAMTDQPTDLESNEFDANDVVNQIGNDISSQQAVPAAICTFVKCLHLNFSETLLSAFSLGGDTDTIGTMAGALAGAHFGYSSIPHEWQRVCEGLGDAVSFADQLYDNMFNE